MPKGLLQHIVAYITGGAYGIGKAVAENILCQGGKVVLADISNMGAKLAEEMGERALFTCTDVRLEKDVLESIKLTKEKFGGVNVLVNSAGVLADFQPVYNFQSKEAYPAELYKHQFDTNVWGLFNVTRLVVGLMAENKRDKHDQKGVIINLSSVVAFDALPGFVPYSSTKTAISGMTLSLAREFAQEGIRVVGICPGFIETPMTDRYTPEERKRWIKMMLTAKRFGASEEIAHLVQTCIENPLINAANMCIDMGFRYLQTEYGKQGGSKS